MNMQLYLKGVLEGSAKTRDEHLQRAQTIQAAIHQRFGVRNPEHWQVKCLRWFLVEHAATYTPDTRYKYALTVRLIAIRRGRWTDWEVHLRGPWRWPLGRPGRRKRS